MLHIYKTLLGIAILFIPFIASLKGVDILGGMGTHLAFYPLFAVFFLFVVNQNVIPSKIAIPNNRGFYCIILFICWIVISGLVNISDLLYVEFKGISGISRYIIQSCSFFVYVGISVVLFNIIKRIKEPMDFLEKGLLYSFAIVGVYSFFEIFFVFNNEAVSWIFNAMNIFRGSAAEGVYLGRIRSVAAEASFFGMYAGIVFPWVLMRWFRTDNHRLFWGMLNIYLFLLIVLSFSRAAYFIIVIELGIMVVLFYKDIRQYFKHVFMLAAIVFTIIICLTSQLDNMVSYSIVDVITSLLNDSDDNIHKVSNMTRLGSQYAAIRMFLDNPISGVGFGGFGFYAVDYYPQDVWNSIEIQEYGNNSINSMWAPVHGIYVRLLAETGLFGLLFWLGGIIFICIDLYRKIQVTKNKKVKSQIKALWVSIIGCFLCGFNIDAFAVMGLWIFFAFSWYLIQYKDAYL